MTRSAPSWSWLATRTSKWFVLAQNGTLPSRPLLESRILESGLLEASCDLTEIPVDAKEVPRCCGGAIRSRGGSTQPEQDIWTCMRRPNRQMYRVEDVSSSRQRPLGFLTFDDTVPPVVYCLPVMQKTRSSESDPPIYGNWRGDECDLNDKVRRVFPVVVPHSVLSSPTLTGAASGPQLYRLGRHPRTPR